MTETATIPETTKGTPEELAREAMETAKRLLKTQGWFMWKCATLGGDTVAIMRDDPPLLESQRERMMLQLGKMRVPYTLYTLTEWDILCEDPTPQFLHEAKKAGAVLTEKIETQTGNS